MASVIASGVRKGNIIDIDGKLYVVLTAENFHPGKGTPTTQIEMRRISDGVKINERYKTTDQLEKAFVEYKDHNFLYQEGDHFIFMDPDTFDQVHVSKEMIGDARPLSAREHDRASLPCTTACRSPSSCRARIVLEVVETEPVTKGQTATSSFKPALLSNGVKTGVPTHIVPGTKIVVNTEDGSYVERHKD